MADGILNPIPQLEADIDFEVYTKQEVDALLDEKADKDDTYTKTETDALLNDKADADAVYTKTETDSLLDGKADKSTTLAGYGITDAYTKTETDTLLNGKADADDVYTKSEIDTKIPSSVGSATKPVYVNGGLVTECTYEVNKTVPANAVFTDTTYTAGNGLNLSGTSFSAKAGTNVTVDSSGINVNGNGAVASADSGLINGGTAYTELRPTLDGTWVKNAQTTATNLEKLESGLEYAYAILSKQYDQLKKYVNGNYYDFDADTDAKYVKNIPANAMPYADLQKIGGKTLVWNQLLNNITASNCNASAYTTKDTGYTPTRFVVNQSTGTSFGFDYGNLFTATANHKYLVLLNNVDYSLANELTTPFNIVSTSGHVNFLQKQAELLNGRWSNILPIQYDGVMTLRFRLSATAGITVGDYICGEEIMVFDLTLMFGAGKEPSTVAEFQQMFPASYYSYNAGQLLSAGVTSVISKDSTDTEIASYPIPAEIQALEGYGWSAGSVYNYVDYENKKFVQRVGSVDLGTLSWAYSYNRFSADVPNMNTTTTTRLDGLTCIYPIDTNSFIDESMTDKTCKRYAGKVLIKDSAYTTTSAFTSAMNGVYLYYELATPIETDISAYLTDDTISVESGGTLTFPNSNGDDYRIDVPSEEEYLIDLSV